MKRYVKEFAADAMKKDGLSELARKEIKNAVTECELGFITNHEAVRYILKLISHYPA